MEAVRLVKAGAEGRTYRHYQSKWFSLDSTADEPNTRRVIVRAEQIFAAYRQIMPPRAAPVRPLRLVLLGSLHEYQSVLVRLGVTAKFQNPACFIEDKNTVVIGSDLTRLSRGHEPTGGPKRPPAAASCASWSNGSPSGFGRWATRCARAAFPTARWAAS